MGKSGVGITHRPPFAWVVASRRYGTPVDHSVILVEYGRKMTGALDQQTLGSLLVTELPVFYT